MNGFMIWALAGAMIIAIGIRSFFAKKPAGFWANAETVKVSNVKGYNHATGILFMVYGAVFIPLGLPLSGDQGKPFILLSILGVAFETIVAMAVYTLSIEKKYASDGKKGCEARERIRPLASQPPFSEGKIIPRYRQT